MSANTKIPWAHHTVNFWWGCEKVSPACEHCYAEGISRRFHPKEATWGKDGKRLIRKDAAVRELRRLDKSARKRGVRERVFIESMGDLFEDRPDLAMARNLFFVVAEKLTNLDLLLLTKRPENVVPMLEVIRKYWMADKLPLFPHIWIGATVENQEQADKRIAALFQIPAKVRFLSCEPLLGSLDLRRIKTGYERMRGYDRPEFRDALKSREAWGGDTGLHWVICGGESGNQALPMHPDWARSLRDQCKAAGVPFFSKQWGQYAPCIHDAYLCSNKWTVIESDGKAHRPGMGYEGNGAVMCSCDKCAEANGRLLDGREHNEFPNRGTK